MIKRLFGKWIEWESYKKRINFLSDYNFQQEVRKESYENDVVCGIK